MSACSKIRHIVKLRQMLRRWRKKAAMSANRAPSDVPAGHVAVSVGVNCKRFVVLATYLNHPIFRNLLVQAEEEYGFCNTGPLAIPCDELVFEEIVKCLSRTGSKNPTRLSDVEEHCHVGFLVESRPLLSGINENSFC